MHKSFQKTLNSIFDTFIEQRHIFNNKNALQASYKPKHILHRENEIHDIASILAPALRQELPSNVFIYGKTGTGKTSVITWIGEQLGQKANEISIDMKFVYVNIKLDRVADTEYRLFAHLGELFGEHIPATGLPTSQVFDMFKNAIERQKSTIIIVLDEIDRLISKTGDDVLYNLTRLNATLQYSKICIIGITNNLNFLDSLDSRVKSSLSEEEILFKPYNALQLQDILKTRSQIAFCQGSVTDSVINKCAAHAAREHGDARKALDLLRVAGEIAERKNKNVVTLDHVDLAESKIDFDRIVETVKAQPKQSQAVLLSILHSSTREVTTGEVYTGYTKICHNSKLSPLTQRRVSDLISELDMLGIINANTKSLGRHGRTRIISIHLPEKIIKEINSFLSREFIH